MTKLGLTLDPSQRYVWYRTGAVVFACDTLCLGICPGDVRRKHALQASRARTRARALSRKPSRTGGLAGVDLCIWQVSTDFHLKDGLGLKVSKEEWHGH